MSTRIVPLAGFNFEVETDGNLERILRVWGRLVDKRTSVASGDIPDPLSGSVGKGSPLYHHYRSGVDKGHIIAQSLGGPNNSINIVPMYSYFNRRGPWRGIELQLQEQISSLPYVAIEIEYSAAVKTMPQSFKVQSSKTLITHATASAPIPMAIIPAAPYDPAVHELGKADITDAVAKFRAAWDANSSALEIYGEQYDDEHPYAILDDWNDQFPVAKIAEEGVSAKFDPNQLIWIKMFNSLFLSRDSFLLSDDPHDPHKVLNCFGGWDAPQVDHILPKSWGGNNAFYNAQLVSAKSNSDKRARVTAQQKADALARAEKYKLQKNLRSSVKKTQKTADRRKQDAVQEDAKNRKINKVASIKAARKKN